jgi:hypothetical protein
MLRWVAVAGAPAMLVVVDVVIVVLVRPGTIAPAEVSTQLV